MAAISVVDLLDKNGKVVGYATGTPQETANMARSVWTTASTESVSKADVLRAALVAKVQELRGACETNGVEIDGNVFATDTGSQIKYVGALLHTTLKPDFVATWRTVNNGYVKLDAVGIKQTCTGVLEYIQTCYAWEQALMERLASAQTVAQLQAVDVLADKPFGKLPPAPMTTLSTTSVSKGDPRKGTAECTLSPGSDDSAGEIVMETEGTVSKAKGSVVLTVSFSGERPSKPFVVLQASSATSAALRNQPFVTVTRSGFTLTIASAGSLAPDTSYAWTYHVR